MNYKGIWQAVLGELEVTISRASFATWFKHTGIIANQDGHVVVAVPSGFTKKWFEEKYHDNIKAALAKVLEQFQSVEYRVSGVAAPAQSAEEVTAPPPQATRNIPPPSLNTRYNFTDFVVGSSNEVAYAASLTVAEHPGAKYNPLFLYGGVGLGKTHLMQAVGNEIRRRNPVARIEYCTSEGFTNEFVSSISRKKTESFTAKYRKVDVLIVDDMQFLGGKEKTQEEFFHTFNALHQANKQIILSSDKPPKAIPHLEERLRSRFEMGMIADIQPPDLETRAAILQNKARRAGLSLPSEVVEFLARNISHNIRELEGALTQLLAHCEVRGLAPSLAVAASLLSIQRSRLHLRPLSPKTVIERVASFYELRPVDITGSKRDREIVVPRQIAMYLMRSELNLSFPKIAAAVGGRDHTTAMHSVSKIERHLESDETLRSDLGHIRQVLLSQPKR